MFSDFIDLKGKKKRIFLIIFLLILSSLIDLHADGLLDKQKKILKNSGFSKGFLQGEKSEKKLLSCSGSLNGLSGILTMTNAVNNELISRTRLMLSTLYWQKIQDPERYPDASSLSVFSEGACLGIAPFRNLELAVSGIRLRERIATQGGINDGIQYETSSQTGYGLKLSAPLNNSRKTYAGVMFNSNNHRVDLAKSRYIAALLSFNMLDTSRATVNISSLKNTDSGNISRCLEFGLESKLSDDALLCFESKGRLREIRSEELEVNAGLKIVLNRHTIPTLLSLYILDLQKANSETVLGASVEFGL